LGIPSGDCHLIWRKVVDDVDFDIDTDVWMNQAYSLATEIMTEEDRVLCLDELRHQSRNGHIIVVYLRLFDPHIHRSLGLLSSSPALPVT
jgi:hypothetical protein